MFAIISVVFFAISFLLYAIAAHTSPPWTWEGFALLGLLSMALHAVFAWYPWRHTP